MALLQTDSTQGLDAMTSAKPLAAGCTPETSCLSRACTRPSRSARASHTRGDLAGGSWRYFCVACQEANPASHGDGWILCPCTGHRRDPIPLARRPERRQGMSLPMSRSARARNHEQCSTQAPLLTPRSSPPAPHPRSCHTQTWLNAQAVLDGERTVRHPQRAARTAHGAAAASRTRRLGAFVAGRARARIQLRETRHLANPAGCRPDTRVPHHTPPASISPKARTASAALASFYDNPSHAHNPRRVRGSRRLSRDVSSVRQHEVRTRSIASYENRREPRNRLTEHSPRPANFPQSRCPTSYSTAWRDPRCRNRRQTPPPHPNVRCYSCNSTASEHYRADMERVTREHCAHASACPFFQS